MKRLRKSVYPRKVRYHLVGEYGKDGPGAHPHFHIMLFGMDFREERYLWKKNGKHTLFRAPRLEALWPSGYSSVGSCSAETALYCAGYVQKKLNGHKAEAYKDVVNPITGELMDVRPEFATSSRRPGLGREFFNRYGRQDMDVGYCVFNGGKAPIPSIWYRWMDEVDPEYADWAREKRAQFISTWDREEISGTRMEHVQKFHELSVQNWKGAI